MSASQQESQRFQGEWEHILEEQADTVRERVPPKDQVLEEEINMENREVDEIQEFNMMGSEAENIAEVVREDGQRNAVTREYIIQLMEQISEDHRAREIDRINFSDNEEIEKIGLEFEDRKGVTDVDVSASEKEEVTDLSRSIDEMIQNLEQVEQLTNENNPDDSVEFRRQGHLTEMMLRGSGGAFDWNKAEAGIYAGTEFLSGAPRYFAFDDTYDGVMQVAGTGSLQITMRPKIYDEHEGNPDRWIKDFSGGGDRIGMHALSPLIYGPFQSSPVLGAEQDNPEELEEEEIDRFIEVLNGRDKAYGQGFQNEHDSKGIGKTPEEYVTENSKAAFSPELEDIESMEDAVEFPADSEWTFSASVEAGKMKVVDEEEKYDPEEDYDTLDEVTFLESDEAGHVRVGHEDWDLEDGRDVIKMKEFPEKEMFEGTVYVVDEEGNREKKRVVVDYRDEEIFPEMGEEEFKQTVKNHYTADSTAVWESWRMRADKPAFEYRDMCNNPFRDAGMATQVGAFRKWREIQEFAEEQLGIDTVEKAQEMRLGVNGMLAEPGSEDYHDKTGLQYTLNEEEEITLQDAWLGDHEQLEDGMIDILAEGVDEMTTGEAYSAEQYIDTMETLVGNGLTPGEMMAIDYGVEIDGEKLYQDPGDIVVGGEEYAT